MTKLMSGRRIDPRWVAMVVVAAAVALVLVLVATHPALAAGGAANNNSTTPVGSDPSASSYAPLWAKSDETKPVVTLFILVSIESAIVFIGVCAAMFINITRFSHRAGDDEEPRQYFGNKRLEIGWTIIPAIILLVGFIATVVVMVEINDPAEASAANLLHVRVTGHQWWWQFDIPSMHVHTANALQLPDNRPVEFDITSVDVIHSFWVPQLIVQVDATPNNMTHLFMIHPSDGIYPGACYEFCGAGHAWMQFRLEIDKPAAFRAWVKHITEPVSTSRLSPLAKQGERVFTTHSCGACHTMLGIPGANGTAAPNLTHIGSRWGIAGGVLINSIPNLERWVTNPDQWKPGVRMPGFPFLTKHELKALSTFLWESK